LPGASCQDNFYADIPVNRGDKNVSSVAFKLIGLLGMDDNELKPFVMEDTSGIFGQYSENVTTNSE